MKPGRTIRNYAHADAEVNSALPVDGMSEDEIRVTLIATGLGGGKTCTKNVASN